MLINKLLFIFKRYDYNNNKISLSKDFLFLLIISFIVIIYSFQFITKNKLDKENFDIKYIKDILNRKKLTLILKIFKKKDDLKAEFHRYL